MKSVVLDASIILSYLFSESKVVGQKITKLLKQAEKKQVNLLSSTLLPIEVANGLRFKLKDPTLAMQVLSEFMALPIKYHTLTHAQNLQTIKLAYTMDTTVYDTSYHLLAIAHHSEFLTCDYKYFKSASKLGNIVYCN